MTPLTQEHRDTFESSLAYWQRELNLLDWRIHLRKKPTTARVFAEVGIQMGDALCEVALPKAWPTEPTPAELDMTACHELLHVMLKPMLAAARAKDDEAVDGLEHRVITVLERLLAERKK